MDRQQIKNIIEALIFASDGPITIGQLASIIEVEKNEVEEALQVLMKDLEDRSLILKKVSGGYEFATRPEYSRWIKKMFVGKAKSRLTRAALETLAIIAFKQPISRVEVSAIRGVNSDGVIRGLLERKLISISGRAEGPGRPLLFVTTKEFLRYFGINEISDLPKPKEIEALLAEGEGHKVISEIPEEEGLAARVDGQDDNNSEEKKQDEQTDENAIPAQQTATSEEMVKTAAVDDSSQ